MNAAFWNRIALALYNEHRRLQARATWPSPVTPTPEENRRHLRTAVLCARARQLSRRPETPAVLVDYSYSPARRFYAGDRVFHASSRRFGVVQGAKGGRLLVLVGGTTHRWSLAVTTLATGA